MRDVTKNVTKCHAMLAIAVAMREIDAKASCGCEGCAEDSASLRQAVVQLHRLREKDYINSTFTSLGNVARALMLSAVATLVNDPSAARSLRASMS